MKYIVLAGYMAIKLFVKKNVENKAAFIGLCIAAFAVMLITDALDITVIESFGGIFDE